MFICASPLGEAQLNRMLDRCRPLGPASPTGRVNTWPSSTLTPASTADLRPRPTCSATSASVLLRFIRWCSRLSVKVGYERSPASPAASRCSSIPNACLSYANLIPSNPLGRGTSCPGHHDLRCSDENSKVVWLEIPQRWCLACTCGADHGD